MSLGELISELYAEYLSLWPDDPDKAAVQTAASINQILAERERSETPDDP